MGDSSLHIELDEAVLRQAEAFAASRRTSLSALVSDYVRLLGEDIATASLPDGAARPSFHMLRHRGRDHTADFLARGGWDAYEKPMPTYLFACLRAAGAGLVIDAGASTGFYALLAASSSPDLEVLAFEADPAVHALLCRNIAFNAPCRITPVASALSGETGRAPLFVPLQTHGLVETSSSLEGGFKSRHSAVLDVAVTTIDAFLAETGRADAPVPLIKIDVQGHECAVLDGASATIRRCRPVVFVEVIDQTNMAHLSAFIARHGYLDVPLRTLEPLHAQNVVTFEPRVWNHAFVPAERLLSFFSVERLAI